MKKTFQILSALLVLCALVMGITVCKASASDKSVASAMGEFDAETVFLQWDVRSGQYLRWKFEVDGLCSYQRDGAEAVFCRYSVSGKDVVIEADSRIYWTYDAYENCYWQSYEQDGQIYKTKIRAIKEATAQDNALFYQYRTDNGTADVAAPVLSANAISTAKAVIAAGDYETAYRILYEIKDKTDEIEEMLSRFAFVPLTVAEDVETWSVVRTIQYTYDDNGYLLVCDINTSGATTSYTHDRYGNILSKKYKASDGSSDETMYTYDDNGNMLTWNYSRSDGYWFARTYSYDADGVRIESCYSSSNGSDTKETYTYTYDECGNVLTKKSTSTSGFWSRDSYTYDGAGNILTESHTDSQGSWVEYAYTYNSNGNVITEYYEDEYAKTITTHTYDSKNNKIATESKDSYGAVDKWTYTYDADGRLLSETEYGLHAKTVTYTYDPFGNVASKTVAYVDPMYTDFDSTTTKTYQLFYYPNGVPQHILDVMSETTVAP